MNNKYVSVDRILGASNGSIFKITILAAKRALQLADGAKSLIEKPGEKLLDNSLREIVEGKLKVKEAAQK
ncbi:MAG: DNA-directed RNA polymerase subunit omega [Candidatus Omnitrophica bacterium]|nr:DNA-directed RNA polymerase subunit omega [Candidatus Omnitrophota bacterium]